jgi:PAS domain S-box-containing protein
MSESFDRFSGAFPSSGWSAPEDLTAAIEELIVADEELRSQTEELLGTRALLEAERLRYHELFQHAPIAYLVTDARGTVRDANQAAGALLRCRSDRLVGKPLAVFTQDVSRRRIRSVIQLCTTERATLTARLNFVNRRGKIRRVEATVAAVSDMRGEVTELRWLVVDRTRRAQRELARKRRGAELELLVAKRTAELERAQTLKDELLATVSHEFRTALAAIGGYADLLAMGVRGPLTDTQLGDVARIQHAHSHLAAIVNDLLSYSRLVAGHVDLHVDDVLVGETLRSVVNLVAPQANAKQISIDLSAARDGELVVRADGERLRQILVNLVGNAVKFTPAGGHVRISTRVGGDQIAIAVTDDGPGVPADKREAVFQPFVRLSGLGHTEGTGLGLAISREYARAMDGNLEALDTPNRGGCFELRLPRSTRLAGS